MAGHWALGPVGSTPADRLVRYPLLAALLFLARLPVHASTNADELYAAGMSSAKEGKLDAAQAEFLEGHKKYPTDERFLTELAGIAYLKKRNAAAKHWLLEAVKLAPTDAYANEFLGTMYQMDGNLAATLKCWNRVGKPYLAAVSLPATGGLSSSFSARLFRFSSGQIFTTERLRFTEANLARSDVLASVRIDLLQLPQSSDYRAVVSASPLNVPLRGWLGQIAPMLRQLPYQAVVFDRHDMQGEGKNLLSLWRWDPDKRRANLAWQAPVHGNPQNEYKLWFDARDENWQIESERFRVYSGELGASYIKGLTSRLQWTLGGTVSRHTRDWQVAVDNRFDYALFSVPEHRLEVSSWGAFTAARLFASRFPSRLVVTRGGFAASWYPQASGETWKLSAQTQAGREFGRVPVDQLFQLGMERDTDTGLWLRGVLSAAHGRKGTGLLGREYGIAQFTLERTLFHIPFVTLSTGPFVDLGKAWNNGIGVSDAPFTSDAGLQMNVRTIGGVALTLVYGRNFKTGRGAFYSAVSR